MTSFTQRTTAAPAAAPTPAARRRAAILATLGNVLEWYDFTVYGFVAIYIAQTFFPSSDPVASLLASLAVFAVGFVARPIGALILGPIIDRKGRKSVMLISMLIMAVGSLLIAIAPGYGVAGVFGAIVVVIGRLCQGFSAGGEFGSASVFLVEWADPRRRGLFGSFSQIATYGGLIFGVLFVAVLSLLVPAEVMAAWAWRIPFFFGALLAIVVLVLRRRIEDTPVFRESVASAEAAAPAKRVTPGEVRPVTGFFLTLGIVALWSVTSMVTITYMPTYAATFASIDPNAALWAVFFGGVLTVALLPVAGALSDRVGRRPLIIAAAAAYIVLPLPLLSLVTGTHSFWAVLLTQVVFAFPTAAIGGVGSATVAELFETKRRGALVSIASALAIALFGGFGAYICTWLIQATQIVVAPAFYIAGVAIITLVTAFLLPNLAHRELRR